MNGTRQNGTSPVPSNTTDPYDCTSA
jgi:hypothetical protein